MGDLTKTTLFDLEPKKDAEIEIVSDKQKDHKNQKLFLKLLTFMAFCRDSSFLLSHYFFFTNVGAFCSFSRW